MPRLPLRRIVQTGLAILLALLSTRPTQARTSARTRLLVKLPPQLWAEPSRALSSYGFEQWTALLVPGWVRGTLSQSQATYTARRNGPRPGRTGRARGSTRAHCGRAKRHLLGTTVGTTSDPGAGGVGRYDWQQRRRRRRSGHRRRPEPRRFGRPTVGQRPQRRPEMVWTTTGTATWMTSMAGGLVTTHLVAPRDQRRQRRPRPRHTRHRHRCRAREQRPRHRGDGLGQPGYGCQGPGRKRVTDITPKWQMD